MMNTDKKVTLFIQCIVDGLYPEVGHAMVRVFDRLGVTVNCPPDQTCCGQPAFNAGYRNESRTAARRFIEIFEDAEAVVCPSGSCVTMVRHHYPELFDGDAKWRGRAARVAAKTYEFSEYLVDILEISEIKVFFAGRVTYHDSCHLLRNLGIREQPRQLIRNVRGTELVEMTDSDMCCGFGGSFAVKYADISTAMVDEKVRNILDTGADVVVGCDMGCLMNIQGRLSRIGSDVKTMHIAQLLAGGNEWLK
jgi:L-lactate dehydrogenase complex protein LldE